MTRDQGNREICHGLHDQLPVWGAVEGATVQWKTRKVINYNGKLVSIFSFLSMQELLREI